MIRTGTVQKDSCNCSGPVKFISLLILTPGSTFYERSYSRCTKHSTYSSTNGVRHKSAVDFGSLPSLSNISALRLTPISVLRCQTDPQTGNANTTQRNPVRTDIEIHLQKSWGHAWNRNPIGKSGGEGCSSCLRVYLVDTC